MGLTVDDFLKVVQGEVGYKEQSNGTTKYGIWYGKRQKNSAYDNAAWCDMFLVWCAFQAAGEDGVETIGEFAYTPWHASWFARQGRFGNSPKKGAIAFFDWGGSKNISAIDHVGVVKGVDSRGRIVTIEGNTSNMVAERYRSASTIVGYGYPYYTTKKASTSTTKVSVKKTATVSVPDYPLASGHVFGAKAGTYVHNGTASAKDKDGVKKLQARLKERGWTIDVDGIFGPKTEKVVKAFQQEKGLEVDGLVGPKTWNSLWTAPITP